MIPFSGPISPSPTRYSLLATRYFSLIPSASYLTPPTSKILNRLEQFQSLVAQQPENELFRFSLAQALQAAGQAEEAREQFAFCIGRKPDWMVAHILLGKLLLEMERPEDARPILERALELALEQHHEDPERELRALLSDLVGN